MAIAEHTSTPPSVTSGDAGSDLQTASFSPPAESLVIAMVGGGWGDTTSSVTVTDSSGGGAWGGFINPSGGQFAGIAGVAIKYFATAPGSITVSANFTNVNRATMLTCKVLTGVNDPVNLIGAVTQIDYQLNESPEASITPQQTGSWLFGAANADNTFGPFSNNAQTTDIDQVFAGKSGSWSFKYDSNPTTSTGSVTLGGSTTGESDNEGAVVLVEVLPAPEPPAGVDHESTLADDMGVTEGMSQQVQGDSSAQLTEPVNLSDALGFTHIQAGETSRVGLYKPAVGSEINLERDLNDNWDLLDSNFGFVECTSATRPTTLWVGLCIYETDTGATYVSDGTTWIGIPNGEAGVEVDGINTTTAASGAAVTLRVTGDENDRFCIEGDGELDFGNGTDETDTRLYRSGPDTLQTDGRFISGPMESDGTLSITSLETEAVDIAADEVLTIQVDGESDASLVVTGDGRIALGEGQAPVDLYLYRSDTGGLTTDGKMVVAGDLQVAGIGQTRFVSKSADTVRSTATLSNDPELSLMCDANSTYEVEMWLYVSTTDSSSDIGTSWSAPAGSSGLKSCFGASYQSAGFEDRDGTNVRTGVHLFDTSANYQTDFSTQLIYERGIITMGGSSGNIALQWAQAVAGGTTTIGKYSYMKITKLA